MAVGSGAALLTFDALELQHDPQRGGYCLVLSDDNALIGNLIDQPQQDRGMGCRHPTTFGLPSCANVQACSP
jgi:hypothetical protein